MKTKSSSFIAPNTRACGDIAGDGALEICGIFEGNAAAQERVWVRRGGSLRGNIETSELLIESGSKVAGRIRVAPPVREWNKWSRLWQR
ncbi:MAG: polymer-forming cytoskeletal protein [Methylacidiphilales bacterium]|nr:polymer-forming cytoskeletal protein [Candidatus Methylacidiphilales bacterium]MDW8349748.1 polymer-forming cytoskeletal protein [Verrucomicrobiae bacterium]